MVEFLTLSFGLMVFSLILARAKEEKLNYSLFALSLLSSFALIKASSFYFSNLSSFVYFLTIPLTIWICFRMRFTQIVFSSLLIFFSIALVESVLYLIPVFAENIDLINANDLIFFFINILVYILVYLISLNSKIQNLYKKLLRNKSFNYSFLFLTILLILISYFSYELIMLNSYNLTEVGIKFIPLIIVLFIFVFIYILIKHYETQTVNDVLYDYLNKFESIIEQHEINNHEHYNQLAAIKGMNKNKKIDEYISSIIAVESVDIDFIKDIPSQALKGLLMYKTMYYSSHDVKYNFIISKKTKNLRKLNIKKEKYLINLLGIYLDNASEEAIFSDKVVTIEFYLLKGKLNIVISNKLKQKIELDKLSERNFSSKSKGRGKGLYLAEGILNKYFAIEVDTKILDQYFIQHIKTKEDVT